MSSHFQNQIFSLDNASIVLSCGDTFHRVTTHFTPHLPFIFFVAEVSFCLKHLSAHTKNNKCSLSESNRNHLTRIKSANTTIEVGNRTLERKHYWVEGVYSNCSLKKIIATGWRFNSFEMNHKRLISLRGDFVRLCNVHPVGSTDCAGHYFNAIHSDVLSDSFSKNNYPFGSIISSTSGYTAYKPHSQFK